MDSATVLFDLIPVINTEMKDLPATAPSSVNEATIENASLAAEVQ